MGIGLGNLLGGLAAVMPITTSPRGTVFVQQTSCASRQVGVITGALLIAAAFFPKSWSLLVGIPAPVTMVFLVVMLSPLLVEGMKLIVHDNPDYRMGLVIGAALFVGIGLQTGLVPLPIGSLWENVFQEAFIAGGVMLVLLTLFVRFNRRRPRRFRTELDGQALPQINKFLDEITASWGWGPEGANRLKAVAEETLHILSEPQENEAGGAKHLHVSVTSHGPAVEIEFVSASGSADNLEDRIALLTAPALEEVEPERAFERDTSLRLLRHYATSVTHQQYFDIEVVTARVSPPSRE